MLIILAIILLSLGCNSDSPSEPEIEKPVNLLDTHEEAADCKAIADAYFDTEIYYPWAKTLKAKRNNTLAHDLPCVINAIFNEEACDSVETLEYYELIAKERQFTVGWTDLISVRSGEAVEYTVVDSVENFHSAARAQFVECSEGLFEIVE
jgi:hypothetical protein